MSASDSHQRWFAREPPCRPGSRGDPWASGDSTVLSPRAWGPRRARRGWLSWAFSRTFLGVSTRVQFVRPKHPSWVLSCLHSSAREQQGRQAGEPKAPRRDRQLGMTCLLHFATLVSGQLSPNGTGGANTRGGGAGGNSTGFSVQGGATHVSQEPPRLPALRPRTGSSGRGSPTPEPPALDSCLLPFRSRVCELAA